MTSDPNITLSTPSQDALREELRGLFDKAKMPTSPGLAARVLELIPDPSAGASDFADVLQADPALAGRLLKLANSAHFAQRNPVTTVERAVTLLGLQRVKILSLGFQLVSHIDQLGGAPFDMPTFWQGSLLRACLARAVTNTVDPDHAEEAFLIGLLQDCGILLLAQVIGCGYGSLYRSSNLSPTAFYLVERTSFPYTHVDAISVLADEWGLPAMIARPLRAHHAAVELSADASHADRLHAVAYFVGGLRFAPDLTINPAEQTLGRYARNVLGIDDDAWEKIKQQAADEYRRLVVLYNDHLPPDTDPCQLLAEANRQLSDAVDQADQKILDLQAECRKIHRENQRLAGALRDYRERAASDPLTGLPNRGAINETLRQAFVKSRENRYSVAVLFSDLDNFKNLNDAFGHATGDNVLKAVAMIMRREVAPVGKVGRFGGEEFVAVLENVSADEAEQIGQRIIGRVRALDPDMFRVTTPLTLSAGIVWTDDLSATSPTNMISEADRIMYQAKREGKDRCYLERLVPGAHHPSDPGDGAGGIVATFVSIEADADDDRATQLGRLTHAARKLNAASEPAGAEKRKQKRHDLISPCALRYYTCLGHDMDASTGVVRNISTGGAGLVVTKSMVRGEPVEVELHTEGKHLFLAGLVAYCRPIDDETYEVGVQFVTHSLSPILSSGGTSALENLDWVANGVNTKKRALSSSSSSESTT